MTHRRRQPALLAALGALTLTASTHAASLILNDATPGQLVIAHEGFEGLGSTNGSPAANADTRVIAGEEASFTGTWISSVDGSPGLKGVIYIVDPGQTNRVRAKISATWTLSPGFSNETIKVDVLSSPFGGDLGTLPPAFAGLGIPMPDGTINITDLFRDESTGSLVKIPANLGMQYVGDIAPECAEPTLLAQAPNGLNGYINDLNFPSELARRFQLPDDSNVRCLRWWGFYYPMATPLATQDEFELRIYEDVAGQPAEEAILTFPLTNTVRAGTGRLVDIGGTKFPEFVYQATLPAILSLTLDANTSYWITIINNTEYSASEHWAWSTSDTGDSIVNSRLTPGTGPWSDGVSTHPGQAYELHGESTGAGCLSDLTGDNMTDGADLAALLAGWGACPTP